jgi:hypothetical protein
MHARTTSLLLPLLLLLVAACGGGQPEANSPTTPATDAAAPADVATDAGMAAAPTPAPDATPDAAVAAAAVDAGNTPGQKSWTDMSHDERLALMKTAVMPQMKKAFQDFDAKEFAEFSCVTCHGPGIKQHKFDMPNPKLPKLDAKGGFKKEAAKHPKTLQFMEHVVEPQMAQILGLPTWEPSNPSGFGCGGCHTMQ